MERAKERHWNVRLENHGVTRARARPSGQAENIRLFKCILSRYIQLNHSAAAADTQGGEGAFVFGGLSRIFISFSSLSHGEIPHPRIAIHNPAFLALYGRGGRGTGRTIISFIH